MQQKSVHAKGLDRAVRSLPADLLRSQVCSNNDLSFLMEAHDGLSGAIAQRAGFKGLWASGLSIASSLGYRDANEASWSQLVDVVERIVDSAELPVLVDGASGFGNFDNARLLERESGASEMLSAEWQTEIYPSNADHVLAETKMVSSCRELPNNPNMASWASWPENVHVSYPQLTLIYHVHHESDLSLIREQHIHHTPII